MTRREAYNWVKRLPEFWKFLTVIGAILFALWRVLHVIEAQAELVPRMSAVEGRLNRLEPAVDSTTDKLDRILCYVRATAGEGTVDRCALR